MRSAALPTFLVTTVLAVAAVVVGALTFPDRVPTHFGGSGDADDWSTRAGAVTFLGLLVAGLTALFAVLARVVTRIPWEWVNLPDKQRWAELGLQDEVRRGLSTDLLWMGALTQLLTVAITLSMLEAALGGTDTLPGWFFAAFVGWLVVFTGYGIHVAFWRYRAPER